MSDTVTLSIIGCVQVVALALIARRQSVAAKNIEKIEKATNSMKDALVKSTGEAEFAKGKEAGVQHEQERTK